MSALPYAHLGHWSGLIAFAVPGVLTVLWAGWTCWRNRRQDRFAEYWTLSRRDGQWTLVAVVPDRGASRRGTRSPWSGLTPIEPAGTPAETEALGAGSEVLTR